MADMMTFPNTWEEFEELYHITDTEQIYTNGSRLIPSFRVEQWLEHMADRNSSEKPNNCDDCIWSVCNYNKAFEDEPQTDVEIARAIVHKAIDDAVIAEDAYPDLRQKMHDAVDNYEPQTDCAWGKGE